MPIHAHTHDRFGAIPATYDPPISEEVARCAQAVALDFLRHSSELVDDVPRLYALVRMSMGRRPPAEAREENLDDQSVSEGIIRALNAPEGPMPASGTVRVLRIRGTIEDDGDGGSDWFPEEVDERGIPVPHDDQTTTVEDTEEAARLIVEAGCTETHSAPSFYDPDRSHTVDYRTGLLEEVSAHLDGFSPAQVEDIARRVEEGS